jgi:hypothetical protein
LRMRLNAKTTSAQHASIAGQRATLKLHPLTPATIC